MKATLILVLLSFSAAAYLHSGVEKKSSYEAKQKAIARKSRFAVRCSPVLADLNFSDSTGAIPLLEGWGKYNMPVTTENDSADIYFEQGINMYYGFHIIEALASFEKSIQFDTGFAMGYWGKALAYGPNINDFGYNASPDALNAMRTANALSNRCTPVEKGLIGAMQVRYSDDTTKSRETLNQLYADEMKKVYAGFPNSADAAVLYVDALMVQHPWDLYTKDYQPKPWTHEIVSTLEQTLQKFTEHPGASHYYIHAVEASAQPEKALAVSKKLPALMPGVAHTVHMPSHIYIRSGYYQLGEQVNEQAVKSYYHYQDKFPATVNNSGLYLIHNLHMQATCANMDGRFKQAMKSSIDCKNSFDSSWQSIPDYQGIFMQYVYMQPYLTYIRFGKWEEILRMPESPDAHVYANFLWHYGRGLAYARKHDFTSAAAQLEILKLKMNEPQLKAAAPAYANAGIAGAEVAEKILQGVLAEEQRNYAAAIPLLQKAVSLEDSMIYNEPKDWVHPARQYLGSVLCKAKQYADAETVYRTDLRINPNNGWSLTGLAIAQSGQGNNNGAAQTRKLAARAFSKTDAPISRSVF